MALYKDFSDKKLTFLPGTQYRCLYLDDVKPQMLVFDKSVLRGDLMSLVGVVAQADKAAATALLGKKGKLRTASMESDGKVHTLTFKQAVKPADVKSKLQKLNPSLGPKLNVKLDEPEEEAVAPEDPSEEEGPLTDDGKPRKTPVQALEAVEKLLEAWRNKHGDPPVPPKSAQIGADWQKELGRIADLAKGLRALHKGDFDAKEAERARDTEDDARVLQSRVGLLLRKGSYNKVDVKPILAWSWCSANVERGKLLDVLKAVLVPYEAAVKAFHQAPADKTLDAAKKAQGRLVDALEKVHEHYTKKADDDPTKLNITTALLADAKEQKSVLERLGGTLGDLDPKVCEKRGAKVVRDLIPTDEAITQAESKRVSDYEEELERAAKAKLDDLPGLIQREYDAEILLVNADTTRSDEARQFDLQRLANRRDRRLKDPTGDIRQINFEKDELLKGEKKASGQRAAVARFTLESLRSVLAEGEPLLKVVEATLPAYLKARAAFGEAATVDNHKAAWKALQVLEKAVDKGETATYKRIAELEKKNSSHPAIPKLREDRTVAPIVLEQIKREKTILESGEMELPQGKLAKTLADSEDGRRTLDAWVEELGGKAGTDKDKAMVRTAMRARFDLKRLDGEMSTKALPKMYKYLTMVPETHVRDNPKISRILRNKKAVPDGFYNIEDDGSDGLISMDMPRTGDTGAMKALFGVLLPLVEHPPGGWKKSGVKKSEAKIIFSHLTLHEVGHAMDEKLSFMDSRLGNAKYGGWRKEDAAALRKIAGEKLGFYKAIDDVAIKKGETVSAAKHLANDAATRKQFLEDYLTCLQKRTDLKELKKQAEKFTLDFDALAKEKGALFIVASRLKPGAMQQVQQWDRKAERALVDGRVYQEAYEDTYWSYDVSARSKGIGGYQFRAPGEWFSEIYACYYGGRLKSDHPDYAWLNALVANK